MSADTGRAGPGIKPLLTFWWGIAATLYLAVSGWSQERPNGLFLTSPLSLSSGYDDNFIVGSRALDDSVTLLSSPTLSWFRNTHRTVISVDYQAEGELSPGIRSWMPGIMPQI